MGTLTRLPVPPPRRVDPTVAGRAMLLAPAVGVGLGLVAAAVLLAAEAMVGRGPEPLLPAALAVASVAWMTGGLHLDGLADVADGLSSRRPAPEALALMRRPQVGALAVVVVALVVLIEVAALSRATASGFGARGLLLALVTGRVVMMLACLRGIPAARAEGLGASVAGTVRPLAAAVWVAAVLVLAGWLGTGDLDGGAAQAVASVLVGLVAGCVVVWRCLRRFGGVTGDVLGAAGEVAAVAVLVVCA